MKRAIAAVTITLTLLTPSFALEQYKLITRDEIARMVDGKVDQAIKNLEKYQAQHNGDLESLYGLAVGHALKGDIPTAMKYVKSAVDDGLPFSRFLVGPRDLLAPLTSSPAFKEYAKGFPTQLIHGPLLGCVTDHSAKIWIRTLDEAPFRVHASLSKSMSPSITSDVATTSAEKDYTAIVSLKGLQPDTRYYYQLTVDGKTLDQKYSFRTFPPAGKSAKFEIGFGGGAGYTPAHEHMWNTICGHNLIAFLQLGDNVYIDNPKKPAVQRYCYYRRQSRPEYRLFTSSTSVFAIWDDHDFTTNDNFGGPEIHKPAWKTAVRDLFMCMWNNPYYGGGDENPGCWFDISIADVDFFLLDGRYYRMNPKSDNPRMLGPVQMEWLKSKLKASKATFKMIVSPVPWAYGTKPGSKDPWQGYKSERAEIFSFLEANSIDGVVLLSADRHRSDCWLIKRPGSYDLYEFESSKLTNIHTHRVMDGCLFGYCAKCSFGQLTFDTTKPDPTVTFRIINIDNELIDTLTVKKSQLMQSRP